MAETLVLYLHADNLAYPSWVVLGEEGSLRRSAMQDDALEFIELADNKEVIVLVPSEDVLLTTVKLPQMNRSRLLQALPFAVEDQLVGDIETLHFALGFSQVEGDMPVAVVSIDKMRGWLALLDSWHILPDALMPASLAVPYQENTWMLMVHDTFMARTSPTYAFGGDTANIKSLLQLALTSAEKRPEVIHIQNANSKPIAPSLDTTPTVLEDLITKEQMLTTLAVTAFKEIPLNLLQGVFSVKKFKTSRNKISQWVTYLALSWLVLLFLYPTVSYFILAHQVNRTDQTIAAIYKRQFREATNVVAPKLRMQEKLQKLSADIGENRLLLLLGYVGKGMKASNIELKRFDFMNDELTLELIAPSSDALSTFIDFLTQQGLSAKQQNASLSDSRINAMLVIS